MLSSWLLLAVLPFPSSSTPSSCPTGWVEFQRSCYKFARSPRKSIITAAESCSTYSASLVSVNSWDEFYFIATYLREHDPQHLTWYTSGRDHGGNLWKWDGDRSPFVNIPDLWLRYDQRFMSSQSNFYATGSRESQFYGSQPVTQNVNLPLKYSAFNFSGPENRWGLIPASGSDENAFICEVPREDLNHLLVNERNIDYGITDITDPMKIPRGPKFMDEPKNAVFDLSGRSQQNYISLRCVAQGYPTPTYQWFKEEYENARPVERMIDPLSDVRLTLTDGTLSIFNPQPSTDRGKYHCKATNMYGTVLTTTVQLSFGYIGEFNKKRSDDHARENWGKSISCDPPQHHPRVNYYWTRNAFPNFVEEDRRVFVSHDGNIYFSTVEKIDRANYSCNVQSVISSTGRTGPFFRLVVDPGSSGQKLLFPNNFPKAFPEAPLAGEDVRLECIAYGYPVPSYNWTRNGVTDRLPEGATTNSHNRVLYIPKVKVEDQGEYTCTTTSGRDVISKAVTLSIQALPVFTVPLTDKIADRGASLVWTCEAFGIPDVTYKWYKNGKELDSLDINRFTNGRYKIRDNVLTIDSLLPGTEDAVIPGDEGMYQCRAINALGSTFSSAQLKVMSLKPSFKKHKLIAEMYASVGSNFTIPCIPEAVPFPQFQWRRNNMPVQGGRVRVLPNGFLHINPVDVSDSGEYACIARNEHGSDETTGYLTVFPQPRVVEQPKPRVVAIVNDTIQLECLAYADSSLDVAYIWLHNGLRVNFTRMPQFSLGDDLGYLKISNITFAEAGDYQCQVKTSIGTANAKTELIIHGPPASPGAVLAEELSATSARIMWSDGTDNGRRILAYTIEGRTNHNQTWGILAQYLTQYSVDPTTGRKSVQLNGVLSPWSTYEFRVIAINELGAGIPSEPSPQYNTDKERPFKYPSNVGGGGGKTGTLTITWDPLPPSDWNTPEIWYKIYYKAPDSDVEFRYKELRNLGNIAMYTVNVGDDNYYKRYIVQVQAINPIGAGPLSPETEVYSAEAMPQVVPSLVRAFPFNSTALNVSWAQIDFSREKIRGKLIGHRIKYWRHGHDYLTDSLTLLNRSPENWGLIVALQPDTEYYVTVMAYNDAGSGPEAEPVLQRTYKAAPQRPPTSVNVRARDATSVIVTWRGGATVTSDEEPIIGYKVRYWEADQPIAKAKEVYKYLDGGDLEAVISGLVPGKIYKLRVLAYSWGGDGKMSSPAWEFKMGTGDPPPGTSNKLTAGSLTTGSSLLNCLLSSFLSFCVLTFLIN